MAPTRPDREPLSSVDTAWYRMEDPVNPVDIGGVLIFEEPLDYARFRDLIIARFLRFDRFRQRVVDSPLGVGAPHWEIDPNFDIDNHIHHLALPEPGDKATLQTVVSELMSQPMDLRRALWQFTVIDNVEGGSAVFARLHHCLGDGFALVHVLLSVADNTPAAEPVAEDHRSLVDRLVHEAEELLRHPSHAAELLGASGRAASALGHLVMLPFDPPTGLRGELSGIRRVAWSEAMSLDGIKALGRELGATVNDVLMAAMAGAFRRYLQSRAEPVDDLSVRAIVPVNLRPANRIEEMDDALGNRFGLVFLELPISEPTPLGRLSVLKEHMDQLKQTPEAVVVFGILNALGKTPTVVEHIVQELFARKASTVVTNVPGPRQKLVFVGKELSEFMFWVPHPAQLAVGMSIISYAGDVRVGVRTDTNVVSDPEILIELYERELEELEASAR